MFGTLPVWLQDLKDAWPVVVSVVAAVVWLVRSAKRWMQANVSGPIGDVHHRVNDAALEIAATQHLVRYHLGENGTTTPVHVRLQAMEDAQRQVKDELAGRDRVTDERASLIDERMEALRDTVGEIRSKVTEIQEGT